MFPYCFIILQGYSTNTQDNDYYSLHSFCPCGESILSWPIDAELDQVICFGQRNISGCDVSKGFKCACTVWLGSCFQWFSALRITCPREPLPLQPVSRTNVSVADLHSGTKPSQFTTRDRAVQISKTCRSWMCYLGNLWEWINACCKQLSFGVVCYIALLCQ